MANYVIAGGGPSGLYTAYRLLKSGNLKAGQDTVNLYEWSERLGGRIYTYTFPSSIATDGLYVEVGGMRFATDAGFPNSIVEGHLLVQNMIVEMGLQKKVIPFVESLERMYYLRGKTFREKDLTDPSQLPYNFNAEFSAFLNNVTKPYTADNILAAIASVFAPSEGGKNADRPAWCQYYASGTVDQAAATTSFPKGTAVRDIGYWNLLYDQLGDEGFDYVADGNGYTSNVINWNSADAMQANNDYGSGVQYSRLDGGYSTLFDKLANNIEGLMQGYPGSGIHTQQQLVSLANVAGKTACTFNNAVTEATSVVAADYLFLAMPRRALEMVAANSPGYALSNDAVKFYLESSIDQPAIKAVMVFSEAWWANAPNAPDLQNGVGGPTITDLPLRQIYYFGNNVPGSPNNQQGGPFVLLASYDDMNYSDFWRQLEVPGDYAEAPSLYRQPLSGPTQVPVNSPFAGLLIKQLAEAHGMTPAQVPQPLAIYFQDWGQDPFGGGYHGWSAHYNICQAMDYVRAPYQKILKQQSPNLYIIGSCYSFDQAWVEGAFCTAESVLQDFFKLAPFRGFTDYALICTANM